MHCERLRLRRRPHHQHRLVPVARSKTSYCVIALCSILDCHCYGVYCWTSLAVTPFKRIRRNDVVVVLPNAALSAGTAGTQIRYHESRRMWAARQRLWGTASHDELSEANWTSIETVRALERNIRQATTLPELVNVAGTITGPANVNDVSLPTMAILFLRLLRLTTRRDQLLYLDGLCCDEQVSNVLLSVIQRLETMVLNDGSAETVMEHANAMIDMLEAMQDIQQSYDQMRTSQHEAAGAVGAAATFQLKQHDLQLAFQQLSNSIFQQLLDVQASSSSAARNGNNNKFVFAHVKSPRRWIALLRAACSNRKDSLLLPALCDRIGQGDGLAKLQGRHMIRLLETLGDYTRRRHRHCGHNDDAVVATTDHLMAALLQRLRKQKVQQSLTMSQQMRLMQILEQYRRHALANALDVSKTQYGMLHALLPTANATASAHEDPRFGLRETTTMCRTAAMLTVSPDLCKKLHLQADQTIQEAGTNMTMSDVADIMTFLATVDITETAVQTSLDNTWQQLSDCFLQNVRQFVNAADGSSRTSAKFTAKAVHKICRAAWTLDSRRRGGRPASDNCPLQDAVKAALPVLVAKESFLTACKTAELANLAWFASSFGVLDFWMVVNLMERLLDEDVYAACTPKQACRVLCSCVGLCEAIAQEDEYDIQELQGLTSNLFGAYGPTLLQSTAGKKIQVRDASMAAQAYAKASYLHDMGIFALLVEQVANTAILERELEHATRTLWACGKLLQYEAPWGVASDQERRNNAQPPYLAHAHLLAVQVSISAEALSNPAVVQALTSLVRLDFVDDATLVQPILREVERRVGTFNRRELINLLWCLSQVPFAEYHSLHAILQRLKAYHDTTAAPQNAEQPVPHEAAMILVSLARLDVRDDAMFALQTRHILHALETTGASVSPQTIAQVLWAHRHVHLLPPRPLLDCWAQVKLGITTAMSSDSTTAYRLREHDALRKAAFQMRAGDQSDWSEADYETV